jgi:hypothetical protein
MRQITSQDLLHSYGSLTSIAVQSGEGCRKKNP